MHGLKVQVVHSPRQVLRKPRFVLDERLVDQQLGRSHGQLQRSPLLNLLLQRPKFLCIRSTPMARLSSSEKCLRNL